MKWFLAGKVYNYSDYEMYVQKTDKTYTLITKHMYENCGFTISQIEAGFKEQTTWKGLKSYFKKLKPSRSADIDEYFALYE